MLRVCLGPQGDPRDGGERDRWAGDDARRGLGPAAVGAGGCASPFSSFPRASHPSPHHRGREGPERAARRAGGSRLVGPKLTWLIRVVAHGGRRSRRRWLVPRSSWLARCSSSCALSRRSLAPLMRCYDFMAGWMTVPIRERRRRVVYCSHRLAYHLPQQQEVARCQTLSVRFATQQTNTSIPSKPSATSTRTPPNLANMPSAGPPGGVGSKHEEVAGERHHQALQQQPRGHIERRAE